MAFRRFNRNHLSSSSKLEDEALSTIYSDMHTQRTERTKIDGNNRYQNILVDES